MKNVHCSEIRGWGYVCRAAEDARDRERGNSLNGQAVDDQDIPKCGDSHREQAIWTPWDLQR
jgi:hypothetical protein